MTVLDDDKTARLAWLERHIIEWVGPSSGTVDRLLHAYRDNRCGGPATTRPAMAEALVALAQDRWVELDEHEQAGLGRFYWRLSVKGRVLRGLPIIHALYRGYDKFATFSAAEWHGAKWRVERAEQVIAGQSLDPDDDHEMREAFGKETERNSLGKVIPLQRSPDGP
jgi:hypothetical protein